jgi:hypothetical protein
MNSSKSKYEIYRFLDSKMSNRICHSPTVEVKTYWININYWRLLQNHSITFSKFVS